jgi:hypothetical protein
LGLVSCVSSGWAIDDLWRGAGCNTFLFARGGIGASTILALGPTHCGAGLRLIVLASAGLNITWGWQLRHAEDTEERRLALRVVLFSGVGMVADWVSGYYGFGSLMALLAGLWLIRKRPHTIC